MRILRFDSVGGASGDMLLSCFVDLGTDVGELTARLRGLSIESFSIKAEEASSHGLAGTRVTVATPETEHPAHRHLGDIIRIIDASELPERVRQNAKAVFQRLAEAEAHVHGTTPDHVHFHEVGAMDAIIDIVGSCLALHLLEIDHVACGPLPVGCGSTRCAHGTMPLPVPATAELLKGHRVVQTDEPSELVTPTGAALLTSWMRQFPAPESTAATITAIGNGIGHRELTGRPNLLRATVLETASEDVSGTDTCLVLECNLDDTVPELIGSLSGKLLAQGALDVFTTPVQMKKQRPATLLTVLCRESERDALVDTIFAESTTFGVREYPVRRSMLDRRFEDVTTPYGTVRVKLGILRGEVITRAPEHDDCVRCAQEHGVAVRAVYEAAARKAD